MTPLLQTVSQWWTSHPSTVSFFYFIIAIAISLFTSRAREFVVAPFRNSANWMDLKAKRDLKGQLETIKSVHNNVYNLTLFLAYYAVDAILWSGAIALVTLTLTIVVGLLMHNKDAFAVNPYSAFFGGIIARTYMLRQTLGYLYNYESSVKSLEAATSDAGQAARGN